MKTRTPLIAFVMVVFLSVIAELIAMVLVVNPPEWFYKLNDAFLMLGCLFCIYVWYRKDSVDVKYHGTVVLGGMIILLPIIAVPYYLLRSRPPGARLPVMLKFIGFIAFNVIAVIFYTLALTGLSSVVEENNANSATAIVEKVATGVGNTDSKKNTFQYKLNICNLPKIDNISLGNFLQIKYAIDVLIAGKCGDDPYFIIEEEQNDMIYLQVYYYSESNMFQLEYQDGDLQKHFESASLLNRDELDRLFTRFINSKPNWDEGISWRRMNLSENKNKINKKSNNNENIEIVLEKVTTEPPCIFSFKITNNSNYNITEIHPDGFFLDSNRTVEASLMAIETPGRLKYGEFNFFELAAFQCDVKEIKNGGYIKLKFPLVEVDGKIYDGEADWFEKLIHNSKSSMISNINLL